MQLFENTEIHLWNHVTSYFTFNLRVILQRTWKKIFLQFLLKLQETQKRQQPIAAH